MNPGRHGLSLLLSRFVALPGVWQKGGVSGGSGGQKSGKHSKSRFRLPWRILDATVAPVLGLRRVRCTQF